MYFSWKIVYITRTPSIDFIIWHCIWYVTLTFTNKKLKQKSDYEDILSQLRLTKDKISFIFQGNNRAVLHICIYLKIFKIRFNLKAAGALIPSHGPGSIVRIWRIALECIRRVENRIGPIALARPGRPMSRRMRSSDAAGCCAAAQCSKVQRARCTRGTKRQRCVKRGRNNEPFFKGFTFFPLTLRPMSGDSIWKTAFAELAPSTARTRTDALVFFVLSFFFSAANFVSRSLSLEVGIAPSCATSPRKLSIDRGDGGRCTRSIDTRHPFDGMFKPFAVSGVSWRIERRENSIRVSCFRALKINEYKFTQIRETQISLCSERYEWRRANIATMERFRLMTSKWEKKKGRSM